jgi:hypothetical protein
MSQFISPDVPAYLCYLLVLMVGTLVAVSSVNRLLANYAGHWGFARTWLMFTSYVFLPVALFWFLDYTSALQDTSRYSPPWWLRPGIDKFSPVGCREL